MFSLRAIAALACCLALAIHAGDGASSAPLVKSSHALGGPLAERVQAVPGGAIGPDRDCQTVRECRFIRGGIFRGCISAYSCRVCQFVPARCTISGRERTCQRLRCQWGA